jgi:thioredoxin 1
MTVELTTENFDQQVMDSDKPVLVDFWASWCGPCRMVGPVLEQMATEQGDRAVIGKLNVDQHPEIAARFGIRNIPTLLFFKGGEIVDKQVGAAPLERLHEKMNPLL